MRSLVEFCRIAEESDISVDYFTMSKREALSIMDDDGQCYVAIDPQRIASQADEKSKLAHELGHCITGSFYNQYSGFDCRQKHENRADKWAIREAVPEDELDNAVADGCTTLEELADRFGITPQLMKKAVCWYTYGNLAADLYF